MRRLSKREILLMGSVLVLLISSPWFPYLSPQHRNLKKVREHIATIQPQWLEFRTSNPGCELVELFPYSGKEGLLGANGSVARSNDLANLRTFLEDTQPPRPLHLIVKVEGLDLESYQKRVDARLGRTSRVTE